MINNKVTNRNKQKRKLLSVVLLAACCACFSGCGTEKTEQALAYRKIGINAMAQGEYDSAIENFQLALDQSRGMVRNLELDICMNKAEALYLNGQMKEAIEVCNAVLEYNKGYATAYYLRGNMYLQQNQAKEALEDYAQAAKYADADYDMYIQLYENLKRAGMQTEGYKYLEQALELKGKSRYHLAKRGYIYYLMGNLADAKQQLEQAVELEKKDAVDDKAELYLAQTCEQMGDTAGAEKYYNAYAKDHADDSIVLEELGNMAMEKKDYISACGYYRKGLETKRPSNEQTLRRGEIAALEQMYEFEQAKEKMAQYVLDYPDDEEAAREYLFLKTRTSVAEQIKKEQEEAAAQAQSEQDEAAQQAQDGQGESQ
ncbi:MAG: tetratricopeptide repeat protein [Eubacterium sp.]|nr:tetratricopeptide repeat protein [Eubacterium sp.]